MSIEGRLNKLEQSLAGDGQCRCPHAGLHVWYGDDGSGRQTEYGEPPSELPRCECGGRQILLRVVYENPRATETL
jgi:hypothetical protein